MGSRVTKVVAGGPVLVALGTNDNASLSVLWTSADGLNWHPVTLDPAVFPATWQADDMAAGPRGIVVTGKIRPADPSSTQPSSVMWSSPDGEHWRQSALPAAPNGATTTIRFVAAGDAGYLAVGSDYLPPSSGRIAVGPSTALLTSPDGLTWRRVPDTQVSFANVVLTGVAAGGPGFVLVGILQTPPGISQQTRPDETVSYTSRDGIGWSGPYLLPQDGGGFAPIVERLFAGQGLVVALGTTADEGQLIWASPDGAQWHRSDWQGALGTSYLSSVASIGGLLVGLGTSAGAAALWTSPDGLHWVQAADDRAFANLQAQRPEPQSMASFQGGLEAVGSMAAVDENDSCPAPFPSPRPSAWRWTPESSQAAPPPRTPGPLDPRTFSLRLSDMPAGTWGSVVGYLGLCSGPMPGPFSSALGKYSAYESAFLINGVESVDSITIVAAGVRAAHAAMLRASAYFSGAYVHPGKSTERRVTKRIGMETRLFDTHSLLPCEGCSPMRVPDIGVIWRSGRALGIVVVIYGQGAAEALRFAAAQDAHLGPESHLVQGKRAQSPVR